MRCAIYGCNSDNQSKRNILDKNIKFHRFPKNSDLCQEWLCATKRKDIINVKTAAVCSKHFLESDYKINLKHQLLKYRPKSYRGLKDDAVPSLNLFQTEELSTNGNQRICGNNRKLLADKRRKAVLIDEILLPSEDTIKTEQVILDKDDLHQELENQAKETEELKNQLAGVKKIFSTNQIKKLNKHKRINWSSNEIASAIALYSAGPRAYRLSLKRGFPHPAVSTLRKWLKKVPIEEGILKYAFKIAKFADMSEQDRVCTLMFNEMKIKKEYVYDQSKDYIIQPYDFVQVAMISGIFKAWKQPIFFNFDCKMTCSILMEIIKFVENSGFHVVVVVSDVDGLNVLRDLNISESKPFFQNPCRDEKIFVMADVPHLLKSIRNNFVDRGFLIDGKVITKKIVEETINTANVSDLKITHKITLETLNCSMSQRHKVKFATKLFSHTVSRAISRCGMLGLLSEKNWMECADFFKLVNDWFDIFNVSTPVNDGCARNRAFGLALDVQMPVLTKMSQVISRMEVVGTPSQLPFQKGILITNCALKMLHVDLDRRYGVDYLLTRRLNRDVLEIFFALIRSKGRFDDHPTPIEFKYTLKSYILGRNQGTSYLDFSNVEVDHTPVIPLSGSLACKLKPSLDLPLEDNLLEEELNQLDDGLECLAGFVCSKLKDHCLQKFMKTIEELNNVFIEVNGDNSIMAGPDFIRTLLLRSEAIKCPEKTKRLFFRSQLFFRIKQVNNCMKEEVDKRNWAQILPLYIMPRLTNSYNIVRK